MKQFILAVAASAALSACMPGIQMTGLPPAINHFEACHEGTPDSDCFTVVPEYCKNRRGQTWEQYRHWSSWDGEWGAAGLLLRGKDASEFLEKFRKTQGIKSFPAGAEVEIFKFGEDYASKETFVFVAAQGCFVKGMVGVWWPTEEIKSHLSHIPHKDLPAFLR